jgi:hypothetical protein
LRSTDLEVVGDTDPSDAFPGKEERSVNEIRRIRSSVLRIKLKKRTRRKLSKPISSDFKIVKKIILTPWLGKISHDVLGRTMTISVIDLM